MYLGEYKFACVYNILIRLERVWFAVARSPCRFKPSRSCGGMLETNSTRIRHRSAAERERRNVIVKWRSRKKSIETHLNQGHTNANRTQNHRIAFEHAQQFGHAALLEGMLQIAIHLSGRHLAASGRQREVVLLPVGRSVGAATLQLSLQQFPFELMLLVIVHRAVEAFRHESRQLAVHHVAGNADADFGDDDHHQKDGKLDVGGWP